MRITVLHIDTTGDEQSTALVVQSLQAIRTVLQPATNGHRLEAAPAAEPRQIEAPAPESEPVDVVAAASPGRTNGKAKSKETDLCACGEVKLVTSERCRKCAMKRAQAARRSRSTL